MSDYISEDTLDEADEIVETQDQTQADDGADEKPQLIFGKYKDMDEAQKGLTELTQKLHSLATENANLKKDADLKGVLEKMGEAVTAGTKKGDDSAEQYAKMIEELKEKFRDDPGAGVDELTKWTNSWIVDEGRKVKSEVKSEVEQLKQELAQLREGMVNMNPDYLENKETVDQLVKDGMPKSKAIEWAKKMRSPDRVIPTSMGGGRVREAEKKGAYISKEERARLKAEDGLDDADIDLMEAEYHARKSGRRLV